MAKRTKEIVETESIKLEDMKSSDLIKIYNKKRLTNLGISMFFGLIVVVIAIIALSEGTGANLWLNNLLSQLSPRHAVNVIYVVLSAIFAISGFFFNLFIKYHLKYAKLKKESTDYFQ